MIVSQPYFQWGAVSPNTVGDEFYLGQLVSPPSVTEGQVFRP
jgi:hypothetical protein